MEPLSKRLKIWLSFMTEEQILDEHPDLEKADFCAVYQFAAGLGGG